MNRVRVSRYGNATGLAVYQYGSRGETRLILHVDVLPKFWAETQEVWGVDLDAIGPIGIDGCLGVRVTCFEGDSLEFKASDPAELKALLDLMVATPFQNSEGDSVEEPADVGFFSFESGNRHVGEKAPWPGLESRADIYWKLVSQTPNSDEIISFPDSRHVDFATQASYLASRSEFASSEIRQFLFRFFASGAEILASRRRPLFEVRVDDLAAVRGRITRRGLVAVRQGLVNRVNCEFDDLDDDSPWYALVLKAAAKAKVELGGGSKQYWSGKLDWTIRKLSSNGGVRFPHRQVLRAGVIPRKLRMFKPVFDMARQILLDDQGASLGSISLGKPVPVATLRVRTAALFENLLDGRELPGVGKLHLKHPNTYKLRAFDQRPKLPDLAIYSDVGELRALIDAKYKAAPPSFSSMPMSDQYQQFAYASLSALPTYFVYVGDTASLEDRILSASAVPTHPVGLWAIPFPANEDLESWWLAVSAQLQERGALLPFQEPAAEII